MDGERNELSRRALLGTATAGSLFLAGCQGVEETLRLPVDTSCEAWLRGVATYDKDQRLKDMRGQQRVTVRNGTGPNGWYFDPPAIRIDPGTTVVWKWTADTARHSVEEVNGLFESNFTDSDTNTFEYTFQQRGTFRYLCNAHEALGHKGVVVVGQSGCQSLYGGGAGQGRPAQNGTQTGSTGSGQPGSGSGQTAGSSSTGGGSQNWSGNKMVVKPTDSASQQSVTAARQAIGAEVVDTVPQTGVQFWRVTSGMSVDQAIQRLQNDPAIAWARRDYSDSGSGQGGAGSSGQR
jgi:halocyanin-like protein